MWRRDHEAALTITITRNPTLALALALALALTLALTLARFGEEIARLRCTDAVRCEVQATLHTGFKEWLQRTGNIRQVTDLMAQPSW